MITAREAYERVRDMTLFASLTMEDINKLSIIDTSIQNAISNGKTYCSCKVSLMTEDVYRYLRDYGYTVIRGLKGGYIISWDLQNNKSTLD